MNSRISHLINHIENNLVSEIENLEGRIQDSNHVKAKKALEKFEVIACHVEKMMKSPFFCAKNNVDIYQKSNYIHADNLQQMISENEKAFKILKNFLSVFKSGKGSFQVISSLEDDIYYSTVKRLKLEQDLIFQLKDNLRNSGVFSSGNLGVHRSLDPTVVSKQSLVSHYDMNMKNTIAMGKPLDISRDFIQLKNQYDDLLHEYNSFKAGFHSSVTKKVENIGLKQENDDLKDELITAKDKIEALREKIEELEKENKELSEDYTRKRLGECEKETREKEEELQKLREIVSQMDHSLEVKERKILKLQTKISKKNSDYKELKDQAEDALMRLKEDYNVQVESYVELETKFKEVEDYNKKIEKAFTMVEDENRGLKIKLRNFNNDNSVMELIKMSRNLGA